MDSMSDFFLAFDQMMLSFADNIQTRTTRDEVMGLIYSNTNSKTEKYTYGSENSDVYIDVNSIAEVLEEAFSTNEEICTCISEYRKKKAEAIIGSWHSNGTEGSLSIYFSTLKTGSLLSVSHPANYVRGKTVDLKVRDMFLMFRIMTVFWGNCFIRHFKLTDFYMLNNLRRSFE